MEGRRGGRGAKGGFRRKMTRVGSKQTGCRCGQGGTVRARCCREARGPSCAARLKQPEVPCGLQTGWVKAARPGHPSWSPHLRPGLPLRRHPRGLLVGAGAGALLLHAHGASSYLGHSRRGNRLPPALRRQSPRERPARPSLARLLAPDHLLPGCLPSSGAPGPSELRDRPRAPGWGWEGTGPFLPASHRRLVPSSRSLRSERQHISKRGVGSSRDKTWGGGAVRSTASL